MFLRSILFPFRFGGFVLLSCIMRCHLQFCDDTNVHSIIQFYAEKTMYICGVKLYVKKDEKYYKFKKINFEKYQYIVLYNHINVFDAIIIYSLFHCNISPVVQRSMKDWYIIGYVYKRLRSIYVEKGGHTSKTNIVTHLESGKSLCIAPDGCKKLSTGQLLHPFFNGAFMCKNKKYLPIIIRYVPSIVKTLNNDGTLVTFILNLCRILYDGHIDVFIQFLDIIRDDDDISSSSSKVCENIKLRAYNAMNEYLSKLPSQFPPRYVEPIKKSKICALSCTILFGSLGIMSYYYDVMVYVYISMFTTIAGVNYHMQKNRNNLLLDELIVRISIFLILFYIQNTFYVTLYKFLTVYLVYQFYRNNYTTYTDLEHVLNIHIPISICSYLSIIDIIMNR